jgi:SAM-dependent methyltransferase
MAFIRLYDNAYLGSAQNIYRQIRTDTYDLDLGQTGWMNAEELREFLQFLDLTLKTRVLEVGCGAGGCALYLAQLTHAQVTGIDVNPSAIEEARTSAKSMPEARVCFEQIDANELLPFGDASFDAVFSNDAMCHIPDRSRALKEWFRVLKPDGRILFTDAMILTGPITNEQLMTRSSIALCLFLPPGENERLIREAGFDLISSVDLTSNAAAISRRWHDARARRYDDLVRIEGMPTFQGLQKFLSCAHTLSEKRLLSRFMYAGRKAGDQ